MAATKPKPVVTAQHETTANNFDAFVREHRDRLVRIAAKRTGDWASAEDAVQDTLIKLWLDQADQTYALKVAPSHAKWGAVTQKRRWDIPIAYLDIVAPRTQPPPAPPAIYLDSPTPQQWARSLPCLVV